MSHTHYRRDFLKTSALAALGGAVAMKSEPPFAEPAAGPMAVPQTFNQELATANLEHSP